VIEHRKDWWFCCELQINDHQDFIDALLYYGLHGKVNEKGAPVLFTLFLAQILPRWASMIFFVMNNPRPIPFSDRVVNLVNNLGSISLSIPFPLSLIDITAHFWSFMNSLSSVICITSPSFVNLMHYPINCKQLVRSLTCPDRPKGNNVFCYCSIVNNPCGFCTCRDLL